jgi:hypothetical protein
MKFHRFSNEQHSEREPRYFVGYLRPDDPWYAEGYRYEVQLLSENGEAFAVILFHGDESPLQFPEYPVPEVVFRAAFGRSGNPGDYVTSAGKIVDFNGDPVA